MSCEKTFSSQHQMKTHSQTIYRVDLIFSNAEYIWKEEEQKEYECQE